jgi:hypothetical protein
MSTAGRPCRIPAGIRTAASQHVRGMIMLRVVSALPRNTQWPMSVLRTHAPVAWSDCCHASQATQHYVCMSEATEITSIKFCIATVYTWKLLASVRHNPSRQFMSNTSGASCSNRYVTSYTAATYHTSMYKLHLKSSLCAVSAIAKLRLK